MQAWSIFNFNWPLDHTTIWSSPGNSHLYKMLCTCLNNVDEHLLDRPDYTVSWYVVFIIKCINGSINIGDTATNPTNLMISESK